MKKKSTQIYAIMLAAATVLNACGSSAAQSSKEASSGESSSSSQSIEAEKEHVTLTMSWWGTDTRHEALQKAIDRFMETYDWITVEPSFSGWDGYHDKLTVQLSTGNAPDLFAYSRSYVQQYGADDTLIDYLQYKDSIPYFSEIEAASNNPYQYVNGKLCGLSTGISSTVVMYNKALFDKAGVEYPTDQESWISLRQKWRQVHQALPEIYGDKGWMYMPEVFPLMMKQLGHEMYDTSTTPATVTIDPVAADKIWSWNEELWADGTISRDSSDTISFAAGNLASSLSASSAIPNVKNETEDPMGFAVLPKTFDGSGKKIANPAVPGGLWGIPSSSDHIEEALLLLTFLQSDAEAVKSIGIEFGVPSVPSSLQVLQDGLYQEGSLEYEMLDVVDRSQQGVDEFWTLPMPAGYTQAQEAYQVELERYIYNEIDKGAFISNAQKAMNEAIANNH